jgi:hypothetical protein
MRTLLTGLEDAFLVRAPRHRERLFHGIVNTDSIAS